MEPVIICNDGIIKMLIESNYNKNSMIYEVLNNCLPLNKDQIDYKVTIDLKELETIRMAAFKEENAVGFESLESMKNAFQIANSKRNGTNNRGFGIFAPISYYKGYHSINLFIPKN